MLGLEPARERTLRRLTDAYAQDALSPATLEARTLRAIRARTPAELAECVWDLAPRREVVLPWLARRRALPTELLLDDPKARRVPWPDEQRSLRIGRGWGCDLRVRDPSVSREHAELAVRGGVCRIRDMHSLNGTAVNGRRVTVADVRHGDVLTLGALGIRLR